ncbi:clusterin associated protein, putative [Trichomonas vaginalis G3]|uniref:Clusterin associated protein, putative n=1 Tax=Trichomonas vaginalis (strain ATCC PRA-98 / G3) TaxID=412133 RepID=A2DLL3_TRIV3|nr:cilium assembly [Trichomonas vaginalis G3]EAY18646.1 clusterin associated protein, putative [Trichomonas vaginalis G3]KAI5522531.1 cilium assembly [Trichomonas vaginalis G3]|eukprot:XP_001579632.1 clusterin associated protein [Trichomonas vaginalis G3]
MTYRELRQFTEIVRILGYPHPVGIDSFDTPNFGLMANLLHWLATLYDPEIVILAELSNEHGRVEFVRGIVQQMAIKSGIRLNPRKLYASDRFAVRELLKIAVPIYRGISSSGRLADTKTTSFPKNQNTQKISQLSATVPRHSVELYDQLDKEVQIRETRTKILSTVPSLDEVEKSVLESVDGAAARLEQLTKELDRLNSDEDALNTKIKQRKHEYERQSKRLMSVQTIRPAYMEEYEMLEQELGELFKTYFQHYRNVDYFEKEISKQAEKVKKNNEAYQSRYSKKIGKSQEVLISDLKDSFNPNIPIQDSGDEAEPLPADDGSDDAF